MKKQFQLLALVCLSLFFVALIPYSGGSPGGKTGSAGDGANCTQCHSGTAIPTDNWITSDIGSEGYVPGETYTITATGTHEGVKLFGFEICAEDAANTKKGSFSISNTVETKLTNAGKAVTHTMSGSTPSENTKEWSFNWTAPEEGSGDITFYAAINAANANNSTSGDIVYTTALTIAEHIDNTASYTREETQLSCFQDTDPNYLTIVLPETKRKNISIQIYNNAGKLLIKEKRSSMEEIIRINISELPSSVYLVQITGTKENFSQKVFINKL